MISSSRRVRDAALDPAPGQSHKWLAASRAANPFLLK